MKRNVRVLALILFILFEFSACSFKIESVNNLIRAPKLAGENQLVHQALNKAVGENIILKTPMSGEYLSAFVYSDIDHDNIDECIAFYSQKNDDTVHMNILDNADGKWFSVGDVAGNGNDVYSLMFTDINGDNKDEILVAWNIFESKNNKYLSVYGAYSDKSGVELLMSDMFTAFYTLDVNFDACNEIFLALQTTSADAYITIGRLFSYNKQLESIELIGEIKLDPSVTSYANICHDYEAEQCRIYLDGVVSETHMITEVLNVGKDDMHLESAMDNERLLSSMTLRAGNYTCCDINDDGYIEIPSYSVLPSGKIVDRENRKTEELYVTTWKNYRQGCLSSAYRYIENADYQYNFIFPDAWEKSVTAIKDIKLERLKFYDINENGELGHLLFFVERHKAADDVFYKYTEKDKVLYSDRMYIYVCRITENGMDFGIGENDLSDLFVKI